MTTFVVKFYEKDQERIQSFETSEDLFMWLQDYWDEYNTLPEKMVVFRTLCLFDAS